MERRIRGGKIDISKLTAHFDFFPTFMELAGIKPVASTPKHEGRSLLPLFSDPQHKWADRYLYFNTGKWEPEDVSETINSKALPFEIPNTV